MIWGDLELLVILKIVFLIILQEAREIGVSV